MLLRLREHRGDWPRGTQGVSLTKDGELEFVVVENAWIAITVDGEVEVDWFGVASLTEQATQLLLRYLDLCVGPGSRRFVVGHLGQSLDGHIAAASGDSKFVTGPENIEHLHRMRALSDVVLVGAETIRLDDPQLTTRLVPGRNPVRAVVDGRGRLLGESQQAFRVFEYTAATTLFIVGLSALKGEVDQDVLAVPEQNGRIAAATILDALAGRGLRRVFVEGGGVTVSRFLEERALTRLQITVSPVLIGGGRRGVNLPAIGSLQEALRPTSRRYLMGHDVMFDCLLDDS